MRGIPLFFPFFLLIFRPFLSFLQVVRVRFESGLGRIESDLFWFGLVRFESDLDQIGSGSDLVWVGSDRVWFGSTDVAGRACAMCVPGAHWRVLGMR